MSQQQVGSMRLQEAAARYGLGRECRRCGDLVPDPEWATLCELTGVTARKDAGMRTCAKCVREQRQAWAWADKVAAEKDERRRQSRPPLGLRVEPGC